MHHAGEDYAVVDYRDKIPYSGDAGESVADRLGLHPGEDEVRQCVLKATVASVLWAREEGTAPAMGRVECTALQARFGKLRMRPRRSWANPLRSSLRPRPTFVCLPTTPYIP